MPNHLPTKLALIPFDDLPVATSNVMAKSCLPNLSSNEFVVAVVDRGVFQGLVTRAQLVAHKGRQTRLSKLIIPDSPELSPSDPIEKGIDLLEQYSLSALPVFEDDSFIGAVTMSTLARAALQENTTSVDSETREALEHLEEEVRFLLHDLKSPISIGLMSCDILEKKESLSETGRGVLSRIRASGRRSLNLMTALSHNTSREAKSSDFIVNKQKQPLRQFLTRNMNELRWLGRANQDIRLHLLECPEAVISIDSEKISRVLQNILDNAVQHSSKHSTILVSAHVKGESLIIQITDEGSGIALEDVPKIFGKYFRSKDTRSKGSGLGLAIAKTFVELHNGTIEARKEETGMTFTICIPCVEECEDEMMAKLNVPELSTESPRILLVDDDDDFSQYFAEQLRSSNLEVSIAANGEEALESFKENSHDLIISDIRMPSMDGFELWEQLKYREDAPPVIFVSGYCQVMSSNQQRILTQVPCVFEKPVEVDQLVATIRNLYLTQSKMKESI